jgi:hypothetical protein
VNPSQMRIVAIVLVAVLVLGVAASLISGMV